MQRPLKHACDAWENFEHNDLILAAGLIGTHRYVDMSVYV